MGKTKVGKGMKLEIVVEASGLPLGLKAAAADVSEQQLLMPALDDVPIKVPSGTPVVADKGHDSDPLRDKMEKAGYSKRQFQARSARLIGFEADDLSHHPGA